MDYDVVIIILHLILYFYKIRSQFNQIGTHIEIVFFCFGFSKLEPNI